MVGKIRQKRFSGINIPVWLFQLSVLCSAFSCFASTHAAVTNNIWQESKIWPAALVEIYEPDGQLRTFRSVTWKFDYPDYSHYSASLKEILVAAEDRFQRCLERSIPTRYNQSDLYLINPDGAAILELTGMQIRLNDTTTLPNCTDESYDIRIESHVDTTQPSWIELQAVTFCGALRGLETVKQLVQFGWVENDKVIYVIKGTPLHIQDQPSYSYRGLMIDTSRHYLPLDLILKNLDVMAANKLNVLHWHMTDKESWPYMSTKFPELATKGAYCPQCYYDAQQIKTVIKEASLLGIRVIVEMDLPGHSEGRYSSLRAVLMSRHGNTLTSTTNFVVRWNACPIIDQ